MRGRLSLAALTALCASATAAAAQSQQATTSDGDLAAEVRAMRTEIQDLRSRLATDEALLKNVAPRSTAAVSVTPKASAVPTAGQVVGRAAASKPMASPSDPSRPGKPPPAGPIDRALNTTGPSFQVDASSEGGEAKLTLGPSATDLGSLTQLGGNWYVTRAPLVELSAPLGSGTGPTAITTQDGLASGAKIKFQYTAVFRQIGEGPLTARGETIRAAAYAKCINDPTLVGQTDVKACDDPNVFQDIVAASASRSDYREYLRNIAPGNFNYAVGANGAIGYKQYTFIDKVKLASTMTERVPLSAGTFVSLLPSIYASSISLSFDYQFAFNDAKSGVLCPAALAATRATACLTGAVGKPVQQDKELIGLDYRTYLPRLPLIGRMAISPQVTYDARSRVGSIDFPIYLVPDTQGRLLGGVRLGYSTDKHDFVAGLFVDTPFTIFH